MRGLIASGFSSRQRVEFMGQISASPWQPSAAISTLKARAQMLRNVRSFFDARGLLEVQTPVLGRGATVDLHIESFRTEGATKRWLQTSPEFAMKRLLAAGCGDVWQLATVFREEESGPLHNPEFCLLEWYRVGWDDRQLMHEVAALFAAITGRAEVALTAHTYHDVFMRHAGLNPHSCGVDALQQASEHAGLSIPRGLTAVEASDRNLWLDLWMSQRIAPSLGRTAPEFVMDFPASQAALARVENGVARRFELLWQGVELANGFWELQDADEQAQRFAQDQVQRAARGLRVPPADAALIDALRAGLPACAGVAIGVDRVLMLHLGLPAIAETLAFAWERA